MTFSLSGFSDLAIEQADVNIGSTTVVDASMKVAAVEETITVTAEAPLIATTPSIGTVVSQNELENLPLNGRQFANVAVLAPGTGLSYNSDPTKPGQLTVLLNGGIGRNLNFTVDGGDNTDDTIGGALQNFNLDAVQEFNIQTSQYKAEYGRSSGGVLSVVTKTGTNELAGSLYDYSARRVGDGEDGDRAAIGRGEAGVQPRPVRRRHSAARSCATGPTSSPPTASSKRTSRTPSTPEASSPTSTAARRRRRSRTS